MKKLFTIGQLLGFYALLLYFGPDGIHRSPTLYVLFVMGVVAVVYQPSFSAFEGGSEQDAGTASQILWSIQITQTLGHLEGVFWRYPGGFDWNGLTAVACCLAVAGLALRTWSVVHLGKAFTWHIDPDQADQLIETGPFARLRHPSYTGAFLFYGGVLFLLQAWVSLGLALVAMPLAFRRRIRLEEAALTARFPEAYPGYKARVGAVVPKLF